MPDIYYVNGNFVSRENAVVSVEDRGYQFSEGLYEVIRTYNGKLFCLEEHIDRLEEGMRVLSFEPPVSREELMDLCKEALKRSQYQDAHVYLQITRGVAKRNHVYQDGLKSSLVIIVSGLVKFPEDMKENGVKVILRPDIRWEKCYIKTTQLLPNTLLKTEAAKAGGFEAILHRGDIVTEGGSSNVFIVKDGIIKTHPADENILHGITRKVVIDIMKEQGMDIREEKFTVKELLEADELFITGTGTEVMPVVLIDDKVVGSGKVGPFSKKIIKIFEYKTQNF